MITFRVIYVVLKNPGLDNNFITMYSYSFKISPTLIIGFFSLALLPLLSFGQGNTPPNKYINPRIENVYAKTEDSVKAEFQRKKLAWPPCEMYVRSFKYDRNLEVWVKANETDSFKLFKTYKVCMQSGATGPKRMEGDYQVPEGFYHINEFNPNSAYHLSLGLNYPNASDRILSDAVRPGSAIYIHGNCVSVGCIPITDAYIEELYIIGSYTKAAGQEFIPVHVFPIDYRQKKSQEFLNTVIAANESLKEFNDRLKKAFIYFQAKKQLPLIMVNRNGDYVVSN